MLLTGFAWIDLAMGIIGATLNLLAALLVRDGRGPLRMFAFVICCAVTAAYIWVITVLAPNPLPSEVGRILFVGLLCVSSCWALVDLIVWWKRKAK